VNHRTLIATFRLPLELCPTENAMTRQHGGARAGAKKKAYESMIAQARSQGIALGAPSPVGCLVRCIRYSTAPTDTTGWDKVPIDRLLPTRMHRGKPVMGLGLIAEDSPAYISRVHEWKKAKRGEGGVVVELWGPCDSPALTLQRVIERELSSLSRIQMVEIMDKMESWK